MLFGCYMAGATWNCCCLCASSVYTIQPPTSSHCLYFKPHTQDACLFRCNLPPALLVQWLESFTCSCSTSRIQVWWADCFSLWSLTAAPWAEEHNTPALLRRPLTSSVHDDHYCPVFFRPGSWPHTGQGHDACTSSTVLWTTVGSARMPAKNEWMRCGCDKQIFSRLFSFFNLLPALLLLLSLCRTPAGPFLPWPLQRPPVQISASSGPRPGFNVKAQKACSSAMKEKNVS